MKKSSILIMLINKEGYIVGLDFLITAICFSFLGYGLCYMTLSGDHKPQRKM